jgi:hypothetical protein
MNTLPNASDRSVKTLFELADVTLKRVAEIIGHPNWYQIYKSGENRRTRTLYHGLLIEELHRISLDALRGGTSYQ